MAPHALQISIVALVFLCSQCHNSLTVHHTGPGANWETMAAQKGWMLVERNWICPEHMAAALSDAVENWDPAALAASVEQALARSRSARRRNTRGEVDARRLLAELRSAHRQIIMLIARLDHIKRVEQPA